MTSDPCTWPRLKSGSSIRGDEALLTDDFAKKLGYAFAVWLAARQGTTPDRLTIAVGHDPRASGPRLKAALIDGLTAADSDVLDCGLSTAPAVFSTTLDGAGANGAVMITASHQPPNINGFKFHTPEGGLRGEDVDELIAMAAQARVPVRLVAPCDALAAYQEALREVVRRKLEDDAPKPLLGLHVVVDAGNGAGGFYATDVLAPLGADVSGSQFLEPDGMFPNHIPNPENETAMASICQAVKAAGADLGVIFDTDVDRGAAVDSQGEEINRNRLVALASAIALEGNPGGTIVTDSITSDGLKEYIEKTLGGKHHRFKRGYKNVINEALRLNGEGVNCPLAIETSGHAAMRENHFLDDGAYLVTKILIKMASLREEGKDLNDLLAPLREPAEAAEVRLPITEENFRARGEALIAALEAYAKDQGWAIAPDNREGIRVSFPKGEGEGWFLLRLSVHDPILPINLESDASGGNLLIAAKLLEFLRNHREGVDCAPLEKFVQQATA